MYFLVWPLSLYFTVFTVIFGVDFLTVTFTNPVAPLILSEPVYAIFTLYVFGVSVAILILTWPLASVLSFFKVAKFAVNIASLIGLSLHLIM